MNTTTVRYFDRRPDVVKLFDDLEAFYEFCRFELLEWNPANLYNRESYPWRAFDQSRRPKKTWNNDRKPNRAPRTQQ